jgi:hypothetical protein
MANNEMLQELVTTLSQASQSLADAAELLSTNAVPVAVPLAPASAAAPPAPPGVIAAIAAGAPVSVPPAGLPLARSLSLPAAPIARSAPVVAQAVPVFAPLMQ